MAVHDWAVGEGVSVLSGCTRQGSWGGVSVLSGCTRQGSWGGGKCVKWLY